MTNELFCQNKYSKKWQSLAAMQDEAAAEAVIVLQMLQLMACSALRQIAMTAQPRCCGGDSCVTSVAGMQPQAGWH